MYVSLVRVYRCARLACFSSLAADATSLPDLAWVSSLAAEEMLSVHCETVRLSSSTACCPLVTSPCAASSSIWRGAMRAAEGHYPADNSRHATRARWQLRHRFDETGCLVAGERVSCVHSSGGRRR